MRPYRGMTRKGKKWVYGWYLEYDGKSYIFEETDGGFLVGLIEVLYATIGQQVGLKDKNDKEIYEGDIIEYQSGLKPQRTVIEFEVHCYNAGFYPRGGANGNQYWEIIGNITEKPELLK